MIYLSTVTLLVVFSILVLCQAQFNYSPDWGKRSVHFVEHNCKPPVDVAITVYKVIQVIK